MNMSLIRKRCTLSLLTALVTSLGLSSYSVANCNNLLDYETSKLRSKETINLCEAYQGKVLLFVNTASQCGYTPQFKGLEALHQRYKDDGLVIVGFPSNDFKQEHSDAEKTAEVCYVNYGVTFQMVSSSHVKGDKANPVFKTLAEQTGVSPRWNFYKYIVGKDGKAIASFPSQEKPVGGKLEETIKQALQL